MPPFHLSFSLAAQTITTRRAGEQTANHPRASAASRRDTRLFRSNVRAKQLLNQFPDYAGRARRFLMKQADKIRKLPATALRAHAYHFSYGSHTCVPTCVSSLTHRTDRICGSPPHVTLRVTLAASRVSARFLSLVHARTHTHDTRSGAYAFPRGWHVHPQHPLLALAHLRVGDPVCHRSNKPRFMPGCGIAARDGRDVRAGRSGGDRKINERTLYLMIGRRE